jgi:hypothetical protein
MYFFLKRKCNYSVITKAIEWINIRHLFREKREGGGEKSYINNLQHHATGETRRERPEEGGVDDATAPISWKEKRQCRCADRAAA